MSSQLYQHKFDYILSAYIHSKFRRTSQAQAQAMNMVMSIFKRGEKSMAKDLLTLEREAQAEAALKEKGGEE